MGFMRIHTALFIALMLLLLSGRLGFADGPYRVDGIEAVVDGEVIATSELDSAVALRAGRSGLGEDVDEGFRQGVLESMIDRILLLNEAAEFNIVEVSEDEVDAAMNSLVERFGSAEALADELGRGEMTLQELRDNVRDQIIAVKYVDRRIRFFVRVTLDDQKRYYEENAQGFGVQPFYEVADEIREILVERGTNAKLGEYLDALRKKADVRYPDERG
jgi:hypothetical protein